jgi:hypothetical protein
VSGSLSSRAAIAAVCAAVAALVAADRGNSIEPPVVKVLIKPSPRNVIFAYV